MILTNTSQKNYSFKKLFGFIFSFLFLTIAASAQIDPGFNPVLSSPTQFQGGTTEQPDGKILVYGQFQVVQGVARPNIARLNADGSLDASFNCTACDFRISSAVVQPDGKILVGGRLPIGIGAADRVRRLNADGSLDTSFTSPFGELPGISVGDIRVWGVHTDGKIVVSQYFSGSGDPLFYLHRLNTNGSIDASFPRMTFFWGNGLRHTLQDIKLLPDGKLLIGGRHNFGFLFRVNPDATKDNSFTSPVINTSDPLQVSPFVQSFDIQSDGKIVLMGVFNQINSVSKISIARLNADQTLDTAYTFPIGYQASGGFAVSRLKLQSDDKLLASGTFADGRRIVRVNTNAALDNTYNPQINNSELLNWNLDASDRVLLGVAFPPSQSKVLARLNTDGSRDTTFNVTFGIAGKVKVSEVQADGKILIGGTFVNVNNVMRRTLARINPDGTLDESFNPGNGFNADVLDLAVQSDGKILAAGSFTFYNGTARPGLARINPDGSLDTSFNPSLDTTPVLVAVQADGKILIGGVFTTVNGGTRTGLARLNADGTLDDSFNPVFQNRIVMSALIQPDGKILVGGQFTTVNGTSRKNLARLNADGSLDTSFDAGNAPETRIIARQADGKFLISDKFSIYRKNADGSPDASFQSPNFNSQSAINAILPQANGTILVGGSFTNVNSIPTKVYLVSLTSTGTLQNDFLPGGINAPVLTFAKQADNKVIVGGEFVSIGGFTRLGIARLNAPVVPGKTPFDYDGDSKADISVFRPSENKWYILQSSNYALRENIFGLKGDIPTPADFDGDGKTDIAVYRPSSGAWWYLSSVNGAQVNVVFGQPGDLPRPSDFDGDGKTDFVLYRPSNSTWHRLSSTGVIAPPFAFGVAEDKPLVGDFDGDGKADPAIFRPSTGDWWYAASASNNQFSVVHWGAAGDIPSPADVDADGKTDFVVYRPSNGGWYILRSGEQNYTILQFGTAEDKPVMADYDGDGKADVAVFRPSSGTWYLLQTTSGFGAVQWGATGDVPTENAFLP